MEGKLRRPPEAREHGGVLISGVQMATGLPQDASRDADAGSGVCGSRDLAKYDGIGQGSVVLPVTWKQQRGEGGCPFDFGAKLFPLVVEFTLELKKPIWSGG